MFVVKPGIELISFGNSIHPDNILTWVIAGCSIEASLELIAHKEAIVARLTSSKTKAMDKPLYRIYDTFHNKSLDTRFQKKIIKDLISIKTQFSNTQSSTSIPF